MADTTKTMGVTFTPGGTYDQGNTFTTKQLERIQAEVSKKQRDHNERYLAGWTKAAKDWKAGIVDRELMVGVAVDPFVMGYRACRRSASGKE